MPPASFLAAALNDAFVTVVRALDQLGSSAVFWRRVFSRPSPLFSPTFSQQATFAAAAFCLAAFFFETFFRSRFFHDRFLRPRVYAFFADRLQPLFGVGGTRTSSVPRNSICARDRSVTRQLHPWAIQIHVCAPRNHHQRLSDSEASFARKPRHPDAASLSKIESSRVWRVGISEAVHRCGFVHRQCRPETCSTSVECNARDIGVDGFADWPIDGEMPQGTSCGLSMSRSSR